MPEVEMKIRGLMMDPVTNMPIVILKDVNGNGILPIWVGIYEANAIALEIEKVSTPRPMTHDLIRTLLHGLDTSVRKIVVNELKEDTFYAMIWLEKDGQLISVDSRPSDALAVALRQRGTEALARGPQRRGSRPIQDVAARKKDRSTSGPFCITRLVLSERYSSVRGGASGQPEMLSCSASITSMNGSWVKLVGTAWKRRRVPRAAG